MSPFQGLKGVFGAFTQGVALGYVILPFQGDRRLRTIFYCIWLNSYDVFLGISTQFYQRALEFIVEDVFFIEALFLQDAHYRFDHRRGAAQKRLSFYIGLQVFVQG